MCINGISDPCVYGRKLCRSSHHHEGNHHLTLWIYAATCSLECFEIVLHRILHHVLIDGISDLEELDFVESLDLLRIAGRLDEAVAESCTPAF